MKKLLVVTLSLLVTSWGAVRAADDPGQIYADAYILEQDAQAAEANSDWAAAAAKYTVAAEKLRGIRTSNPDWNSTVVEFRLKDVSTRLDAIKDKVPAAPPPPLPTAEAPAPAALAAEFATPEATSRLRAEVERLKDENTKLVAELDDARKSLTPPKPDKQTEQLKQQNRQLTDQLSGKDKESTELKRQLTGESAEMKKLRTDLTQTHADLEAAQKSSQQVAELQKQNKELADRLALAQRQAAAAAKAPSESADLKKLRAELAKAQADADQAKQALAKAEVAAKEHSDMGKQLADLEKQNAALRGQIAAAKSAPAESPELAKLRTELDATRKASQQQASTLQQQNKDLSAQLAAAKSAPAPKAADSAELKKLRTDLANTQTQLDTTKKANQQQLTTLQAQNKQLAAQLTAAQQKPAAPASESVELKKLRADLAAAKAEADQAKTATARITELESKNKQLTAQLAAKPGTSAPDAEVKKLRTELAEARAAADHTKQANAQVANLERENKALATQLATARKTTTSQQNFSPARPAPSDEMVALEKQNAELKTLLVETKRQTANKASTDAQNKELTGQLTAEHQRVAELEKQLATKSSTTPADSAELKNLRTQLSAAQSAAVKSDELAKQNKQLTGQLTAEQQRVADLQKQIATKSATIPADSAELKNLRTQLASAKVAAAKSDDLAQQNRELTGKLTAEQHRVADLQKQIAAKAATAPADSPELQKLRADLAAAQTQVASSKAAAAKADEVAKQNQDLSGKLAVAQQRVTILEKQVAANKAESTDTTQLRKLQTDLADARNQLSQANQASAHEAALAQENQLLSTQLAASMTAAEAAKAAVAHADEVDKQNKELVAELEDAKKGPYIRPVTTEESAEIRQLKAELDEVRTQSNHAPANAELADLEKQNKELAAQLEQAKTGSYIRPLTTEESTEIRQLRAQIDDMQTEVRHAQSANTRLDDLEKENSTLKVQMDEVRKNAISKIEIVDRNPPGMQIAPAQLSTKDAAAMKKLRDENSYLRNLLESYSSQVPDLKPRLKKYQQQPATAGDQTVPPSAN